MELASSIEREEGHISNDKLLRTQTDRQGIECERAKRERDNALRQLSAAQRRLTASNLELPPFLRNPTTTSTTMKGEDEVY